MRILFCNYEYPPLGGGGGVINALLAEELAKSHEVAVLTSHGLGLPLRSVQNGVQVVRVPVYFRKQQSVASLLSMIAFLPLGIRAGRTLLRANRYDVINTHFVVPTGPVGNALANLAGIPNVLSLHGGDLYDPSKMLSPHRNPLLRAWIRRLLRRADVVVGQSRNTLANMRRYYAPEIEGTLIPLGIPKPEGEAAPRSHYGFDEHDRLLVTVGRLVARKAIPQLILMMEAFRGEPVRLLIIGDGPQQRFLQEQVRIRRLGGQVLFLGYVEEAEKFRVLRMCDAYVSTSQHEGFGLVFLEAMACGLPVVCYDHGGQTDFLVEGKTGYLVPLNDIGLFRKRCHSLIADPALCRTIGEGNKERVEDFYIDRVATAYEGVFLAALTARARRERPQPIPAPTALGGL